MLMTLKWTALSSKSGKKIPTLKKNSWAVRREKLLADRECLCKQAEDLKISADVGSFQSRWHTSRFPLPLAEVRVSEWVSEIESEGELFMCWQDCQLTLRATAALSRQLHAVVWYCRCTNLATLCGSLFIYSWMFLMQTLHYATHTHAGKLL